MFKRKALFYGNMVAANIRQDFEHYETTLDSRPFYTQLDAIKSKLQIKINEYVPLLPPGLPAPALHHMKHMFLLSDEPTWMLSADLMHLFFHQFFSPDQLAHRSD